MINSSILVLIDFHAEWCQPCKVQSPILQDLAREHQGKIRILKIDVDKNPDISNRYQIRSVPTLMLFRNGNILWKHSGLASKQQIAEILKTFASN